MLQRERESSNSKTLFYKDCSLGSDRTCLSTRDRQTDRKTETKGGREGDKGRQRHRERRGREEKEETKVMF